MRSTNSDVVAVVGGMLKTRMVIETLVGCNLAILLEALAKMLLKLRCKVITTSSCERIKCIVNILECYVVM